MTKTAGRIILFVFLPLLILLVINQFTRESIPAVRYFLAAAPILAVLVIMIVFTQYSDHEALTKPAKRLLIITLHQVVLGVLAYVTSIITGGTGGSGFWKVAVIRKHKLPASMRHLVPGAFVLANIVMPLSVLGYTVAGSHGGVPLAEAWAAATERRAHSRSFSPSSNTASGTRK